MPRKSMLPIWQWLGYLKIAFVSVAVIVMGLCVFSIWPALNSEDPFTVNVYQSLLIQNDDIRMIEGNAEIELPPSAREIYALTSGFQEMLTMIRFTIAADELSEFLANTLCEAPFEQIELDTVGAFANDPDWWEPYLAENLMGCDGIHEYSDTQYCIQSVRVDMTNVAEYTIYVTTSCN